MERTLLLRGCVDPRFISEARGTGMFLDNEASGKGGVAADTLLLEELPIVACQSLRPRQDFGIECCPKCLAFAHPLGREVERLQRFFPGKDGAAARQAIGDGAALMARFVERLRAVSGAVPTPWFPNAEELRAGTAACPGGCGTVLSSRSGTDPLLGFEGQRDEARAQKALSALRLIADTGDEGTCMVVQLAALALAHRLPLEYVGATPPPPRTSSPSSSLSCRAALVAPRLAALVPRFALGKAMSFEDGVTKTQARVYRAIATNVSALVRLSCGCDACEEALDAAGSSAAPLVSPELVLEVRRVMFANLHTAIVTNPLWNIARIFSGRGSGVNDAADQQIVQALGETMAQLEAHKLHNSGFAFYHLASRFNHSCEPNTRYMLLPAPVRFALVSSRAIDHKEEVCYTYVDVDAPHAVRQRGLDKYGFTCDCSRCRPEGRHARA
jgi:hypothetical protein